MLEDFLVWCINPANPVMLLCESGPCTWFATVTVGGLCGSFQSSANYGYEIQVRGPFSVVTYIKHCICIALKEWKELNLHARALWYLLKCIRHPPTKQAIVSKLLKQNDWQTHSHRHTHTHDTHTARSIHCLEHILITRCASKPLSWSS